ncbi:MAG: c-type cytochrome [Roseinatronobacter sp.]
MKLYSLFAKLALVLMPFSAAADPQTPHIAQACAGCHGQSGAGMGAIPDIAGYDRDAFVQVWEEFRAGERFATIMTRIAPGYTDEEVATLADYFASLR